MNRLSIESVATLGKSFSVKLEKHDDDMVNMAHLKFSRLFIRREQMDEIIGRGPGWAEASLFDELGAPIAHMSLSLPKFEASVTGTIGDPTRALKLMQATLTGVELNLTKLGAEMSGELSWTVAGDEASDVDGLLGNLVAARWDLTDGGQQDMLAKVAA